MASPFRWTAFRGRARVRVLAGFGIMVLGLAYGSWAAGRLGHRGAERAAFDQPIVRAAGQIVWAPDRLPDLRPQTSNEVLLLALVRDQQDMVFGLTLLLFRAILALTVGGLGMVLLTAGSTEWELASRVHDDAHLTPRA